MTETRFKPKSKFEDHNIIFNDDYNFSKTKEYLDPLILDALDKFKLSRERHDLLYNQIIGDIPIAAKRFIANKEKNNLIYNFNTKFF